MGKTWTVGSSGPDPQQLDEIAALLRHGEVFILPTDTIYGLHGSAANAGAVARVFAIKGRQQDKALPVLFASLEQARKTGVEFTPDQEAVLNDIWPARLTAILHLSRPLPAAQTTVAARVPALPWLRELLNRSGPLASTSANLSGDAPAIDPSALPHRITSQVAGIVDCGALEGKASTIVDFTSDPPRVVRPGEFLFTQNLWKKVWKSM